MTRYVLIGMGVAAIAAAEAIRSLDQQGELILVSDDPFGYYSRPGLAYYLTGELTEKFLFPYRSEDFRRLRAWFYQDRAVELRRERKEVVLASSRVIPYDKLLIATGAQAIPLSVPGATLKGVHKLDHLSDARALLASVRRGYPAVVTGGGITALELAEGLAARGMKVHYVLRGERYWSNVLDETESRLIESLLSQHGITLHFRSEIAEILGKKDRVQAVRLTSGQVLRAHLVAYAIGIAPRIDLARQAGLACERGILVDETMRTGDADIFAAGDVAQVYDPLSGRHVLDSLWAPAREQGTVAGRNMAGDQQVYRRTIPFNVTRLGGLTVTILGRVGAGADRDLVTIARGDSEVWRETPDAIIAQEGFEYNRLRLMVGERHLLGAVLIGDQKLSGILQTLIREQIDITPIRAALLDPNADLPHLLLEFASQIGLSAARRRLMLQA